MKDSSKIIILMVVAIVAVVGVLVIQKINNSKIYFKELNYEEITTKITNKESFLLVIEKEDCPYCELFFPKMEEIINNNKVKNAYYVNTTNLSTEEHNNLSNLINYDGTPTTVFFDKGIEMDTWTRIDGNQTNKYIKNRLIKLNYLKEE